MQLSPLRWNAYDSRQPYPYAAGYFLVVMLVDQCHAWPSATVGTVCSIPAGAPVKASCQTLRGGGGSAQASKSVLLYVHLCVHVNVRTQMENTYVYLYRVCACVWAYSNTMNQPESTMDRSRRYTVTNRMCTNDVRLRIFAPTI